MSLIGDYLRINRSRNAKVFAGLVFFLSIALFGKLLGQQVTHPADTLGFVIRLFVGVFFLSIIALVLCGLVFPMDAYLAVSRRARELGVPLRQYLQSDDYKRETEIILKREYKR